MSEAVSHGANYVLVLATFENDTYSQAFPAVMDVNTRYRLLYYERLGASPAADDLLLNVVTGKFDGSSITEDDVLPSDAWPPVSEVKRIFNISSQDTSKDQWLIDNITDMVRRIEKRLGRPFSARTKTEWLKIHRVPNNCSLQGGYNSKLRTTILPINSIASITIGGIVQDSDDYNFAIRGNIGEILINPSTFGNGYAEVIYNAGYALVKSADEAPYMLVKKVLHRHFQAIEKMEDFPDKALDFTDDELAEIDSWRMPWDASSISW